MIVLCLGTLAWFNHTANQTSAPNRPKNMVQDEGAQNGATGDSSAAMETDIEEANSIAVSPPSLDEAIGLATRYLVRSCQANGRFVYENHLDPQTKIHPQYNLLRHAGTIYALAMAHKHQPNEETRDAILRASRYLQNYIEPVEQSGHDLLAIWSDPALTGTPGERQVKLGGVGLGLIALLSAERLEPGLTPRDDLVQLGKFVQYMQKDDGSFYSKYLPSEGGPSENWVSLYYPGEAALGLVMLYEYDGDTTWLESAARAIGYLARSRRDRISSPPDHWALLATARLVPHLDKLTDAPSENALSRHTIAVCKTMTAKAEEGYYDPVLTGCLTGDGRTTPTATRLEGMLAARTYMSEPDEWCNRIDHCIEQGINFLLRAQVHSGQFEGGMPRAIATWHTGYSEYDKKFNHRAGEIRVDYVQHALSAMIAHRDHTTLR